MLATLEPIGYALFVWWFSTLVIIYLDGLPRRTFGWSMLGATAIFAGALLGLRYTAAQTTVTAAYQAFTCALLAWGWHEISFYMGFVTGPRKQVCAEGCSGWHHLLHAIQASLWHELAILASAAAVFALTWGQPNQVGSWTFVVLWAMHQSAKLNVFLGVRNLNEQFLPEHLEFLKGFLTKKPINLLFPLSVTVSTVVVVQLGARALAAAPGSFAAAEWLFLATLLTLAILEHWFLVLPVPAAALWNWGLRSRPLIAPFDVEVVAGFLGAGKTTVMRRLLAEADPERRTVVLCNDFSDLGIDGALLGGRGAEVVELANGCICCSLQKDLGRQLGDIAQRHRPARVLIEPSGVADAAALMVALRKPELAALVRSLRLLTLVDAAAFLGDFARMPHYFESQARVSPLVLVNKTDLVLEGSLDIIRHTLLGVHPGVRIVLARHGTPVDGTPLAVLLAELPDAVEAAAAAPARRAARRADSWRSAGAGQPAAGRPPSGRTRPAAPEETLGLQSWSATLSGECDPERLRGLLEALAAGEFGRLERVKGIVRAGSGWVRFDLAGGRPAIAAHAARAGESPRVMAIGRNVDGPGLLQAFADCASPGALQHG